MKIESCLCIEDIVYLKDRVIHVLAYPQEICLGYEILEIVYSKQGIRYVLNSFPQRKYEADQLILKKDLDTYKKRIADDIYRSMNIHNYFKEKTPNQTDVIEAEGAYIHKETINLALNRMMGVDNVLRRSPACYLTYNKKTEMYDFIVLQKYIGDDLCFNVLILNINNVITKEFECLSKQDVKDLFTDIVKENHDTFREIVCASRTLMR